MTVSFSHIRLFTAFVPALSTLFLLSVVAVKVPGLFLGERFFRGGCWLQVVFGCGLCFFVMLENAGYSFESSLEKI